MISLLQIFGTVNPPAGVAQYDTGGVGTGIGPFIRNGIQIIVIVAGVIAFYNLIAASIQYIFSGGNPKSIGEARDKLIWSSVGLIVLVASFAITRIVGAALGLNILDIKFLGP